PLFSVLIWRAVLAIKNSQKTRASYSLHRVPMLKSTQCLGIRFVTEIKAVIDKIQFNNTQIKERSYGYFDAAAQSAALPLSLQTFSAGRHRLAV
ncbi:TPA: hypothetical protein ACFP38_001191, partial [Neisseria subflava]